MSTTWKALASSNQRKVDDFEDEDWETSGDFENDITEKEQRWGSKTVKGSGRIVEDVNFKQMIGDVQQEDKKVKEQFVHESARDVSKGFGGKFGIQKDRKDQSAVGWDYHEKVDKHESQKDYSKGFGGKFGIEKDKMDKSAVNWDYHEKVDSHESQKDYSKGFGGKFGIEKDKMDKSAVDWDYHEKVDSHESQKDYSKGFGGKFGIEKDKMDKSAVNWDYHEKLNSHKSQISSVKPTSIGKIKVPDFHGQEQSKSAEKPVKAGKLKVPNFVEESKPIEKTNKSTPTGKLKLPTTFTQKENDRTPAKTNSVANKAGASALKSKFENLIKESDSENQRKIEEERLRRLEKEKSEKNKAKREEEERQKKLRAEAEQRRLSEPVEAAQSDESSGDEVVSSKVTGLVKQNSKLSNRSSSYDSDTENNAFDEEVQSGEQSSKSNKQIVRGKENAIESKAKSEELEEMKRQKELELQRELEEEELRRKLAEDDESLIEDDTSEEKEIRAVALYDYEAAESDELSFLPGDIIGKIDKVDSGWWRGQVVGGDGKVGLFPSNYVEQLDD